MKHHRQSMIRDLVDRESITSQEQLRARLKERGVDATQATLSRDIRELGLVKRATDGAYRSSVGAANGDPADAAATLARVTAEYLRTQEAVGNLLVLRTDPGQAQTLAIAIDSAAVREIVGTIGGDDTILVVCRTAGDASGLAERFAAMQAEG